MKKAFVIFLLKGFIFSALAQQKTDPISTADRITALSIVWSSVKQNFANFQDIQADWDSAYKATIPSVLAAKNVSEVYKEMAKMVALLKDGHTGIYHLSGFKEKKLPLKTEWTEGKVIITRIDNDSITTHHGLQVGDEIIAVDKMEINAYAEKYIRPYQFASTPQDLLVKTYTHSLLYGDADKAVELTVRRKDGSTHSCRISRNMQVSITRPSFTVKILEGNIALLSLHDFQNNNYKKLFDSLYNRIIPAKALIIDVRRHTGGNGAQGNYILSHFIDKHTTGARSKTKQYVAAFTAWGRQQMWMEFEPAVVKPVEGKEKFLKPVVLLTGAQTYSAAEDLALAFDVSGRGIKIGQATAGSTGQPLRVDLPGNGLIMICSKRDSYPDGKEFIGIGIIPEIVVNETVQDIRTGNDAVLNKATEYLLQKIKE